MMAATVEKTVSLNIPFSCPEAAVLACKVLSVDKELKGSVRREINADGEILRICFHGIDMKSLRVAVNGFLKNVLLVVKTISLFENS